MKLPDSLKIYSKEQNSAAQAQRHAQEIAFAPVVFQISRLMVKYGILNLLYQNPDGLTLSQIVEKIKMSEYAIKVLLEASLSIGTVIVENDKFFITKTGWFLINDKIVGVNMNFNHYVNYNGLYYLDEALQNGKPEGLKVFGDWKTIYEGLSSLPQEAQKYWFDFDHFYSDGAFNEALGIVFPTKEDKITLLDVGGNTGRWALRCVDYNKNAEVTILDLPTQLEMMKNNIKGKNGADRIHAYPMNLLDSNAVFPDEKFDVIWMSQFLDCFSENEIIEICSKAKKSMKENSRIYIMETFWDRQRYETAAYCLTLTSPYFTAMANGNSKMYHSGDMEKCVIKAGLSVEKIIDGIGMGHSLMICKL